MFHTQVTPCPRSVAQDCTLRAVIKFLRARTGQRSADFKSAIRQSATLRYDGELFDLGVMTNKFTFAQIAIFPRRED
jgi:hypothetical protein